MKFTIPRRHRKVFSNISKKKLDENFTKDDAHELLSNIIEEYNKSPASYGTNRGQKESSLELAMIIANQVSAAYKDTKVELERGVPVLRNN
tara:strand:- start:590 stop:862 length:273 start_codon:yes stop_codon:yes gene_type:complete